MRERSSTIVTPKYGTSTGILKTDTDMKQFRARGGGVRVRSSTIVTSKYGTSTGIHKTDTDLKQFRAKGGGGERAKFHHCYIKIRDFNRNS